MFLKNYLYLCPDELIKTDFISASSDCCCLNIPQQRYNFLLVLRLKR